MLGLALGLAGCGASTGPLLQCPLIGWLGAPYAHPSWGEVGYCTQPHSLPDPAAALYKMGALTGGWSFRPKPCCPRLWVAIKEPPAWVSPGQTLNRWYQVHRWF